MAWEWEPQLLLIKKKKGKAEGRPVWNTALHHTTGLHCNTLSNKIKRKGSNVDYNTLATLKWATQREAHSF